MRLHGKTILMMVGDGVKFTEFSQLKEGFESEGARIVVTTAQEDILVKLSLSESESQEIVVDLPIEAVREMDCDGLIIPEGLVGERNSPRLTDLVGRFHEEGVPIFASGHCIQLLYEASVLSNHVMVREEAPLGSFITKAVEVLVETAPAPYRYRPTMAL
jgi:putative intracellular protease/amidase